MDSTIEDPHAEAGAHLGAGASGAMGLARLATALLHRQRQPKTAEPEAKPVLTRWPHDPRPVLDDIHPDIGRQYQLELTSGGDRESAMSAAAERGETIVMDERWASGEGRVFVAGECMQERTVSRKGDGAFAGHTPFPDRFDMRTLDDQTMLSRQLQTRDGRLHASLGSHTELEWAAIDGHSSIEGLNVERQRRFDTTGSTSTGDISVDASAMKAATDARKDARDAEVTPDDPSTPTINEHAVGQNVGSSDRARASSYVTQAFPDAKPNLSAPAVATPAVQNSAATAIAKVARGRSV